MLEEAIPDLTFPMVPYGKLETPVDLRVLLYKGGAKSNPRTVFNQIAAGELGQPLSERMALVTRMHEDMTAKLVGGESRSSFIGRVNGFRRFVAWADDCDQVLSFETVIETYHRWCDFLYQQQLLKLIKSVTAYNSGLQVSSILSSIFERSQPLILSTCLRRPRHGARAVGVEADKQNLADTFAFGQLCLDVVDSLPVEVIYGTLPVKIRFRNGQVLEHWSKLHHKLRIVGQDLKHKSSFSLEAISQKREQWEADHSLKTRSSLVNLRIIAELLVFISQTGMNFTQAFGLLSSSYVYKSTIDGFEVRAYKDRRKGEVLFEIFAEYKSIFQSYLVWREKIFGTTTDRLFPLVRTLGAIDTQRPDFREFDEKICIPAGVRFITPKQLRKTRINWLLRRSRDPEQTAEQAQHTVASLLRNYEQPSLQVAMVEITQFWRKNDPMLAGKPMPCPAIGVCDGVPKPLFDLHSEAPKPDCVHPTGCLFCEHHRDIDSADYVLSAMSMRYLYTLILQRFRPPAKGKINTAGQVELVIERLTAKLKWFNDSNAERRGWVEEAIEKLAEGEFHSYWCYLIESVEGD